MDGAIGPYLAVGVTGLVHGLEPGHGWPLAVFLARRQRRSAAYAGASGLILGLGHLVSSFAAVAVYLVLDRFVDFSPAVFSYVAGGVLLLLAYRMWREAPEREPRRREVVGLLGLAWLALVLGFAHEEEFVLLALAVGGLSPLALMSAYALAVLVSLVTVSVAMYLGFGLLERRFGKVEPYLPRVTALVLALLGVLLLLRVY